MESTKAVHRFHFHAFYFLFMGTRLEPFQLRLSTLSWLLLGLQVAGTVLLLHLCGCAYERVHDLSTTPREKIQRVRQ